MISVPIQAALQSNLTPVGRHRDCEYGVCVNAQDGQKEKDGETTRRIDVIFLLIFHGFKVFSL